MNTSPLFPDETELTFERQAYVILDNMNDGFFVLNSHWCYTYINRVAEVILKTKREDLLGKNVWEIFPEFVGTIFWQKFYEAAKTQAYLEFEEFYPPLMRWYFVRVYPSKEGLIVYFQDTTERKQGVEETQRNEQRAQIQAQLIELAHDAILVRDPASRIVTWNKGAERLYGWTAQEAIGQISHELLKTRFPVSREEVDVSLATGEHWEGELVHTRKDGSEVIVESRQVVTCNDENLPIAILEVNRNITKRKQRERENQEQYRTIVQTANEGIWLIDTQVRTLFMNDRMANLLGYKVEEIMGRAVPEFTFPEDGPKAQERIGSNLQGNFEQFDFRFRRKDGSALHVLASTSPVRDGLGEITGALGMFTDMTERKKAEADQLRLAAIVEDSDDAIVSKTLDGIINSWNHAAEKMFGYTAQEVVGKPIYMIIPEELREEENTILRKLRNGEHIDHFETERMRKDGTRIEVSLSISPMRNKEGRIIGASKIARDITERIQAEQRKDEFISMTSHELKTPVTGLKGFTHVLQRRLARQGDEQGLHYVSRMNAQLDKLIKIIGDLLDISRMQTGHLAFQNEAFDLDELIYETVENVQVATTTHQFVVEGRTNACILGDKDRLGQVFINLFTNAEKYSPKADKVIVHLSQEQEKAIVSVQDFGIGINPSYHQKIFERFYQVTDPEERTYPGLGIGLYISRQIVEQHHGQISIQSRKGEGSTFSVTLPLYKKESEQKSLP